MKGPRRTRGRGQEAALPCSSKAGAMFLHEHDCCAAQSSWTRTLASMLNPPSASQSSTSSLIMRSYGQHAEGYRTGMLMR